MRSLSIALALVTVCHAGLSPQCIEETLAIIDEGTNSTLEQSQNNLVNNCPGVMVEPANSTDGVYLNSEIDYTGCDLTGYSTACAATGGKLLLLPDVSAECKVDFSMNVDLEFPFTDVVFVSRAYYECFGMSCTQEEMGPDSTGQIVALNLGVPVMCDVYELDEEDVVDVTAPAPAPGPAGSKPSGSAPATGSKPTGDTPPASKPTGDTPPGSEAAENGDSPGSTSPDGDATPDAGTDDTSDATMMRRSVLLASWLASAVLAASIYL